MRTCELCRHVEDDLLERLMKAEEQRNEAIRHIAEWCVAVEVNGSGWDDWDEYYKDAMYHDRKCLASIRDLLKTEIEAERKRRQNRYGDLSNE